MRRRHGYKHEFDFIRDTVEYRGESEIELGLREGALKRIHSRKNRAT